jgi:hypothetical protein
MSAGRCPDRGDGDIGTRARSATRGMEARSLNIARSPPDGEALPVRAPSTSELEPTAGAGPAGTATGASDCTGAGPGEGQPRTRSQPDDDGPEPSSGSSASSALDLPERDSLPGEGDLDEGEEYFAPGSIDGGEPPENDDTESEQEDPETEDEQGDPHQEGRGWLCSPMSPCSRVATPLFT